MDPRGSARGGGWRIGRRVRQFVILIEHDLELDQFIELGAEHLGNLVYEQLLGDGRPGVARQRR